ncbi:MAG: nucleotidyltransferase [Verrucomicrobiota bacterium]|nr:nucleotidyltransferase [Verrucomicrobiota bacterium]
MLNKHDVLYLLIGGYAVTYYGYPRTTADMDIFIEKTETNIEKVLEVLRDFGFPKDSISKDIFFEKETIFRMGLPPLRIELLTAISGVNFKSIFEKHNIVTIDNVEIKIIDIESLKKNKKASGRYKDLDDLEHLP